MKNSLGCKLAIGNIRKNYRFFVPRMLTEAGLLICFYIIFTLACDSRLANVKGGEYLPTFMWMGAVIIGLLSCVLMLYTNSFLMKQRKREFGLYSVLGMEKKHICRVLLHESLICSLLSVILGLIGGILFYKLCSLAICKLLKSDIIAGFYFITLKTILPAGVVFIAIDAFCYFINCLSVTRVKTVELLSSIYVGEKEPKLKWVLLILGIISLFAGYAISLTTKNPLQAILLFFAAVLLVIAGTYFLYVAGSIFVLKVLKKKEKYYYQPEHITAISGLLYRMKQNAVGLASVAILATGVLVMISTTFCLYSRTENVLLQNFPQDYYIPVEFYNERGELNAIPDDITADAIQNAASEQNLIVRDAFSQRFFEVSFLHRPGQLLTDPRTMTDEVDLSSICNITFITEEMYIKLGGDPLGLAHNEVAVCSYSIYDEYPDSFFTLFDTDYSVVSKLKTFPIKSAMVTVNCYGMVVADDSVFYEIYSGQQQAYGSNASMLFDRWCVTFENRKTALEKGSDFDLSMQRTIRDYVKSQGHTDYTLIESESFWETRNRLYGMYGTLLFLGILLGIVCLFATVLIIYYKQISEGYEDRCRYQIMHKIGMTEAEAKASIRSQVMLVFFVPLVTAGVHVVFAYPILTKLLEVLLLDNRWLFTKWCIIVYIAFALVYTLIYKLTAKTYYKIVY